MLLFYVVDVAVIDAIVDYGVVDGVGVVVDVIFVRCLLARCVCVCGFLRSFLLLVCVWLFVCLVCFSFVGVWVCLFVFVCVCLIDVA